MLMQSRKMKYNISRVMRKSDFCKCKKQRCRSAAPQPHGCFRYIDCTIPLFLKSEISSLMQSSVVVQPSLCRTWSETQKTGFLTTRLICHCMTNQLNKLHTCATDQPGCAVTKLMVIFSISQYNRILWVLIRIASPRPF